MISHKTSSCAACPKDTDLYNDTTLSSFGSESTTADKRLVARLPAAAVAPFGAKTRAEATGY